MGDIFQDIRGNEMVVNRVGEKVRLTIRPADGGSMRMGLTQEALKWLVAELTEYIVDEEKLL